MAASKRHTACAPLLVLLLSVHLVACMDTGGGILNRTFGSRDGDSSCPDRTLTVGRLTVTQTWVEVEQKCIVMVSDKPSRGKSRSFVFSSHGMLLTFSVFGKGRISRTTGARTHFLLPNIQPLRIQKRGKRLLVHTSSGHVVTFNGSSGRPEGISGGVLRVTRNVTSRSGGGVTLRLSSGIVVDHGFTQGESPHLKPNRKATIVDGKGRRCKVKNKALFSYSAEEPHLRVSSPDELSSFLGNARESAKQCLSLSVPNSQKYAKR